MRTSRLATLLAVGLSLAACSSSPLRANMAQLQSRAAYDLACPAQWMQVYHLDGSTKGVSGCGSRVTYVERCEAVGDGRCTWVLDMKVVDASAPSSRTAESTARAGAPVSVEAGPLVDRY